MIHIDYVHSYYVNYVTATDHACFNARKPDLSTIFNAPKNGTIIGIQLNYINGFVTCDDKGYAPYTTNWGCSITRLGFFTMFLRVRDASNFIGDLYYPQNTTFDIQIWDDPNWFLEPPTTDWSEYHENCQCNLGIYNLTTANARNSSSYSLINPSYNVTTSDQFMLQYLEACCHDYLNNEDNNGTTCASVDFLYS